MKKVYFSFSLLVFSFSLLMFVSCGSSGTQNTAKSCDHSHAVQLTGNELTIVAHVLVNPEYRNELIEAFKAVVDGTRKEPGNISYELMENIANPLSFTFVEVWKSQEAIDEHNNSAHFLKFANAIEGKAELEVYVLKKKF